MLIRRRISDFKHVLQNRRNRLTLPSIAMRLTEGMEAVFLGKVLLGKMFLRKVFFGRVLLRTMLLVMVFLASVFVVGAVAAGRGTVELIVIGVRNTIDIRAEVMAGVVGVIVLTVLKRIVAGGVVVA